MGQELLINGVLFRVVIVMKDFPANSHFKFDMLASMATVDVGQRLFGEGGSFHTYLKVNENINPDDVLKKMTPLLAEIYVRHDSEKEMQRQVGFSLQPLLKIHMHSHLSYELGENGNIMYVRICILLGFFVLLIAAINFANIITVLTEKKIRFFSINEVIGATKASINKLLCFEVAVLVFVPFVLASVFVVFGGKWCIMNLLGIDIIFDAGLVAKMLVMFIVLSLFLFLLSVTFSFVAFFRMPIRSGISGTTRTGGKWSFTLYKALLCIQLIIATSLIGCLYKTNCQLDYLKSKDLGFHKQNVVVFTNISFPMQSKLPLIKEEISRLAFIDRVTASGEIPGSQMPGGSFKLKDSDDDAEIDCRLLRVDSSYLSVMEIALSEGRFFNASGESDGNGVVINETIAKSLMCGEVLGKHIDFWGTDYVIIGVVKDFHTTSLRDVIPPVLLIADHSSFCDLAIYGKNLSSGNMDELTKIFKRNLPDYVPDYYWMSDKVDSMYRSKERMGMIGFGLMIVSILIAFMGIWSFASLFIGKKWKEMGVRKVFGAESQDVLRLLLRNFVPCVLLSFLVSVPLIYLFTVNFDHQFVYNAGMSAGLFFVGMLFVSLVIVAAMIYHCYKVMKVNPVKVLKRN